MSWRRILGKLALGALASCALAAGAQPAPDCPPTVQMPSAQQLAEGARAARDRGFLWRIRKDGRDSWLYGTLHVGRFEWAFPGRTVLQAVARAETLALEIDLTDPQVMRRAAAAMSGGTAPALPQALRERFERQFRAACVPPAALAAHHPVMQAVTLAILSGRRDGLDPSYGAELSLAGAARALKRPIVSLETIESQMAVLVPADPQRALALAERMLEQLERDGTRSAMRRLGEAWSRGDLSELQTYERWCECIVEDDDRAFLRRINDERNGKLADGIDALHAKGSVFAAVGALHMTGPQALPRLMAERGYAVERVAFPP